MPNGGAIMLISIAAAKAGVIGLALSAAASYAARNIRVNCVAPGLIDTPLATRITGNEAALGRIGKPEDIANMIEFLLDPSNSWITGQVFGVDGGLVRPQMPQNGVGRGGSATPGNSKGAWAVGPET